MRERLFSRGGAVVRRNETCEDAGENDGGLTVTPLSPARSSAGVAFHLDEAHGNLRDSPPGARRVPRARTRIASSTCLIPIDVPTGAFSYRGRARHASIERSTRPAS
jgi:hypothetical protein